jgi:hypothetical protein
MTTLYQFFDGEMYVTLDVSDSVDNIWNYWKRCGASILVGDRVVNATYVDDDENIQREVLRDEYRSPV